MIENKKCLACDSENLKPSLNLGNQPLANELSDQPAELPRYPLAVNLCQDCFHLQLTHTVEPEEIYTNYLYASGTSKTLKDYSDWFAGFVDERIFKRNNLVLDIGCNDGTQLDSFKKLGYRTYGIDPAKTFFETSSANHNVYCTFFNHSCRDLGMPLGMDAIVAQNVFAHNPDPREFLEVCKHMMFNHTLLFIQTSQAEMVLNQEFDTIYHEHVNFFNVNSMKKLVERSGLKLLDVVKTPIHGISYIFVISRFDKVRENHIQNFINMEKKLLSEKTYDEWETNVKTNMEKLKNTLNEYQKTHKLIGYGAAAKGNTMLNYIDYKLDYIIDDSQYKQGKYTPGLNIPIVSIEILKDIHDNQPILFIPLAWNFFDEISSKIKNARNNENDKFLKYFPKVEIHV